MFSYSELIERRESIAVIGMGYVGFPLAYAFAKKGLNVIGYDLNEAKISQYKSGTDPTNEIGNEGLKDVDILFTSEEDELKRASFYIVAVPTPVKNSHVPDLSPVKSASEIVGRNIRPGSIVVYESTVFPGCTEKVCIPILERESGLACGKDFKVGYSPERINPGDKIHRLSNIVKIVSGMDDASLNDIKLVYDLIIDAGTFPVSNIRTAEAVKLAENSQRDINIAFVNELAMVFDKMDIDTNEVIDGMNTKWNALGFRPGLVGGHCIGVDPYYFTYEAERRGYHSQIVLNGRIVNDSVGTYVADIAIKKMVESGQAPKNSKVVILGLTFKENCADLRNSKVKDIINRLKQYGVKPVAVDPVANRADACQEFGVDIIELSSISDANCIILSVAHDEFKKLSIDELLKLYSNDPIMGKVLIDVKGIFPINELRSSSIMWWRL